MTQDELSADVRARLKEALTEARVRLSPLMEDQRRWAPVGGGWSIDECLGHLVATHDAYLPGLVAATGSTARRAHGSASFRPSWTARMIRIGVDPASSKRIKAPKVFSPAVESLPGPALATFLATYEELLARIEATEGLDWHGIRLATPVSRLLRLRLGDAYWILAAHAQRHVGQAIAVMDIEGFPEA